MFKEVLQVQPNLSPEDASKMERELNSRFNRVAKRFGGGLLSVLKGAGIGGAISFIADKILNPLKEVQEAIDKSLHSADDIQDQAERFNTTAGELAKLQAFGKSKGLSAEEVNNLIGKFQTAVAEAAADPSKNTSVKNFVGNTDTGQAFLTFVENLAKLSNSKSTTDQNNAIRVQQEVFGEKQIGKSGNFLRADFSKLNETFTSKGLTAESISAAAGKTADLNKIVQEGAAIRFATDIVDKSNIVNEAMIRSLEAQKDIALKSENEKLKQTERLIKLQTTADAFIQAIESKGLPLVGDLISKIENAATYLGKIANSRLIKGIVGSPKGKK